MQARITDTRMLNPQFFAAQIKIQTPIPNKKLECGYKARIYLPNISVQAQKFWI